MPAHHLNGSHDYDGHAHKRRTGFKKWLAFILGRWAANRSYTYGYGRADGFAGLFMVAVVALSVVAAWQSIERLFHPQPLQTCGVLAVGLIGSAALVAVVFGAGGVMLISPSILVLLWGTVKSMGHRLMGGIEPGLVDKAMNALGKVQVILDLQRLQLRWVKNRRQGTATVVVTDATLSTVRETARGTEHRLSDALPKLDGVVIKAVAN